MQKIINNLRKQPETRRRHILHICTGIFAVLLGMTWVYTLGQNLGDPITQSKLKEDLKPFNVLTENMVDGYNSLQ
jgi:membrane protein DedA with SNARE-associated domain